MIDKDKKEFMMILRIVCSSFNQKEFDIETVKFWYSKLDKHELSVVSKAFDDWIDANRFMPTLKDIQDACKPKPTIFARLPSPLAIAENHRHAVEVKQAVEKMVSGKRDMKAWAHKIKANPSAYPDISYRYAKEALGATI